jgi:hypothetical protein
MWLLRERVARERPARSARFSDMASRVIDPAPRRPRVGWTLSRRIRIFAQRTLFDLSLEDARDLHDALGRAIEQAGGLPELRRLRAATERTPPRR